jgi:tripartite-type tricarboxylate transporter receptor subunit TctC
MSKPNLGLVAFTLAFGLLAIGVSRAQEAFPSRAVRIVVPYPAGGGTDIIGRFVAEQLSRKWRQSVTVENVGGGAGNIGAAAVARAAPDGYTLMVAAPGPIATNHFLLKEMTYDPTRLTSIAC